MEEVQMKRVSRLIIIVSFLLLSLTVLAKVINFNVKLNGNELGVFPELKSEQTEKQLVDFINGDVFSWINKSDSEVKEQFGKPIRKDMSAYGYMWWVYKLANDEYIQFGIEDNEVVTVYTTGEAVSIEPFELGDSFEQLDDQFSFKDEVTYHEGLSFYTFKLNEEDLLSQPLIKLSNNLFVQCYFDMIENELSSLRVLTGDVLLKQRFYEMEYRGNIPDMLTQLDDQWEKVEKGLQLQIFDLTNVIRSHHNVDQLIWDENISTVAYNHSKDMSENNYFSHYRQDGTGLKERLGEENIYYLSAGENIAAQHSDAAAAVHGWLNSKSHRDALLNDEFNYLGVGVYRLYYTQNFIYK